MRTESWAYLIGDVSHEGYKAYKRNRRILAPSGDAYKDATGMSIPPGSEAEAILTAGGRVPALEDYRAIMAQRAVFQSIASMGLPAFTIHSIVKYSGRALKTAKNTTIRSYGPIGVSYSTPLDLAEAPLMGLTSLALRLYRSFPTCSTSLSRKQWNGPFTTHSRPLVENLLSAIGTQPADRMR